MEKCNAYPYPLAFQARGLSANTDTDVSFLSREQRVVGGLYRQEITGQVGVSPDGSTEVTFSLKVWSGRDVCFLMEQWVLRKAVGLEPT